MTQVNSPMVATIKRHGGSWRISLPKGALARLGWNANDVIVFTVVGKQLLMTRVEMPKVDDIRKLSSS